MNINSKLENLLFQKFSDNTLAHFYILNPNQVDSESFCLDWINNFLNKICRPYPPFNHEDILYFSPKKEKHTYNLDQFSSIHDFLKYNAQKLPRKFIVITHGGKLNDTQQNKLLKTFEEPPVSATIFLINSCKAHILPTVLSRGVELRINHEGPNRPSTDKDINNLFEQDFINFQKTIANQKIDITILVKLLLETVAISPNLSFASANKLTKQMRKIETELLFNNSTQSIQLKIYQLYKSLTSSAST